MTEYQIIRRTGASKPGHLAHHHVELGGTPLDISLPFVCIYLCCVVSLSISLHTAR